MKQLTPRANASPALRILSRRLVQGSALVLALSLASSAALPGVNARGLVPTRSTLLQLVDDHPWLLLPLFVYTAINR